MLPRIENSLRSLTALDPRVKLFLAIFCLCLVLISKTIVFPVIVFTVSFFCVSILIKRPNLIFHRFEEPFFIIVVLVVLKALSGTKELIYSFEIPLVGFGVNVYGDGLKEGLFIGLRAIASVTLITFLKEITPFSQFLSGLSWFRVPKEIVEILILADRFMFHLLEEGRVIYTAQRNRLGYVGLKRRLSSYSTLVGSLLLRVLDQSQKTALSMSLRGYQGSMPLVLLPKLSAKELCLIGIFVVLMAGLWAL